MNNYIEIKIENQSLEQTEILIAQLNEIGFNGFEEGENFLSAFIDEQNFDEYALRQIISTHRLSYQKILSHKKTGTRSGKRILSPLLWMILLQ